MSRIKTFIKDPLGSISWTLDFWWIKLKSLPATGLTYLCAWAWGIELSPAGQFIGLPHFKKYPGSIIRIGKQCRFRSDFHSNMVGVNHPCGLSTYSKTARILIGKECGFSGTVIGATKSITIGNKVLCGANVTITDFDWHSVDAQDRRAAGQPPGSAVEIEDNVWIGLNALILKGVHIGRNSVIGANSVVTSSIPPNVIAAGNPARVIRSLREIDH